MFMRPQGTRCCLHYAGSHISTAAERKGVKTTADNALFIITLSGRPVIANCYLAFFNDILKRLAETRRFLCLVSCTQSGDYYHFSLF